MPKKIPDVKKKILQSAERLFNSYSYEDVDMRLIAKEAGVSVGTVYYHFSDKSGIFMSACEKTVERLMVSMAGICNSRVHPSSVCILKEMMPKDSPMEDKLIERLILSTLGTFFTLNERFPQEVEENIKYITRALETLLNIRGVSMEN